MGIGAREASKVKRNNNKRSNGRSAFSHPSIDMMVQCYRKEKKD
jgi:hypothetical protein